MKKTQTRQRDLFEIFIMGREEAIAGKPFRRAHDILTESQRAYARGYLDGLDAVLELDYER